MVFQLNLFGKLYWGGGGVEIGKRSKMDEKRDQLYLGVQIWYGFQSLES